MRRTLTALAVGSALLLAACGGSEEPQTAATPTATPTTTATPAETPAETPAPAKKKPAASGRESVAIAGFAFAPATVKAEVGQTIRWTNEDSAAHTVTAKSGGELDSGTIAQGATFDFTPKQAGTIEYFCEIHPSMVGTIEVS